MGTAKDSSAEGSNVRSGNLVSNPTEAFIRNALRDYPLRLALDLRRRLMAAEPRLVEKLNTHSRYLGYRLRGQSDALYVYVQRSKLVLDVRVGRHAHWGAELRRHGFLVRERANFQGQAGWLTGVCVPHDTDDLDPIVHLALEALKKL